MLLRNHFGKEEVLRLHEERGPVSSASRLSPALTCFALPCECTHAKVYKQAPRRTTQLSPVWIAEQQKCYEVQ